MLHANMISLMEIIHSSTGALISRDLEELMAIKCVLVKHGFRMYYYLGG